MTSLDQADLWVQGYDPQIIALIALDQADLWLLDHDPQMAGKTIKWLENKRLRETHRIGCHLDETITEAADDQQPSDFFDFLEKLPDLDDKTRAIIQGLALGESLSQIGQDLGISKQAIWKRIKKQKKIVARVVQLWLNDQYDPPAPLQELDIIDICGGAA